MGNAITPESRAVWAFLARHGGWWTVKAIVKAFSPTFVDFEVRDIVKALAAGRYLVAREMVPDEPLSYSFTSECVPLPGVDFGQRAQREAA